MAIIAIIATPLVLSLINNAKASANKRSVDAYGKAVEMAAMTYLMDNGEYPSDLSTLTNLLGQCLVTRLSPMNLKRKKYLQPIPTSEYIIHLHR